MQTRDSSISFDYAQDRLLRSAQNDGKGAGHLRSRLHCIPTGPSRRKRTQTNSLRYIGHHQPASEQDMYFRVGVMFAGARVRAHYASMKMQHRRAQGLGCHTTAAGKPLGPQSAAQKSVFEVDPRRAYACSQLLGKIRHPE